MNIVFYSNVTTADRLCEYENELEGHRVDVIRLDDRKALLEKTDTDILIVDAMGSADREIIDAMPSLRLIMSEGVGYQGVDVEYATSRGIPVCNNKGVNDTAVSEGTVLLILACLKSFVTGHNSVYEGRQIEVKKASFGTIREIGECTVGLIGFGDIARCTAKYLNALGARVVYTNRTRYGELEGEYNVEYMELDRLLEVADFVSLHVAVTDATRNMVNADFLSKMKRDAFLINTARGNLVDNEALLNALLSGEIAGAGLDVIAPEPVTADNILLDERIKDRLLLTPHIAGITRLTVRKIFISIFDNIKRVSDGKPLRNRVN